MRLTVRKVATATAFLIAFGVSPAPLVDAIFDFCSSKTKVAGVKPVIKHDCSEASGNTPTIFSCPRTSCYPGNRLAALPEKIRTSDVILIPENHNDVSHYAELVQRLESASYEAANAGKKLTLLIELDEPINPQLSEYARLRREIASCREKLSCDPGSKEETRRLKRLTELVGRISAATIDSYDPAKTGLTLALIDRAIAFNVGVYFIDMTDNAIANELVKRGPFASEGDRLSVRDSLRNAHMADEIVKRVSTDGCILVLNGGVHTAGLKERLGSYGVSEVSLQMFKIDD